MIRESLSSLNPLETFNKNAFVGNAEYSQQLCNFILALALIWNDSKNLMLYYEYINTLKPQEDEFDKPEKMPLSPIWGEISGISTFIEKSVVALSHELLKLIKDSTKVVNSNMFQNIRKQLNRDCRSSWDVLTKFALGEVDKKPPLGKALLMVRHKIANHYDKREIFKGYRRKFINSDNVPCISRGRSTKEERFYFADAAAQEYYKSQQERTSQEEFYKNFNLIIDSVNQAIQNLVETFIQKRSAWRKIR